MSLATAALDVRLGGRVILSDITLSLERGTLVGLVGPNGAGKTSLLRTLAGLVAPTKGRVDLDGMPLKGISRDARAKRIAVLFHGAGAGWPMQVQDLVALGRLPHRRAFGGLDGADHAAINRAMTRTDVARFAERTEPTLSSGERMRVLLARALAVEAEWLLADEPITALDPAHQLDAGAGQGHAPQQRHGVELVGRVEGGDRFIGQKPLRFDGERPRQQHAHPLARGQGRFGPLGEARDVGPCHRSVYGGVIGAIEATERASMR